MHRPVCRSNPADVVVSETLRPSFRFASITIGGVLADQLGMAATNYLSDSPLIAAGLVDILAPIRQRLGVQNNGPSASAHGHCIQAEKSRCRLHLEPGPGPLAVPGSETRW
jgi:hypothetical protein